jgi:inner membrane transporter RhtA
MMPATSAAVLSASVAMVSFQIGAAFAKQLLPGLGAPGTTALRLGLSALLLVAVQRPWRSVPSRSAWKWILAYGLSLGAMNAVFYVALGRIPLGIAVAIEFVGPLGVAVWASRRRIDYLWVALAAVGLALLLPIRPGAAALDPLGVACALLAGLGWALYILFGQKAGRAHGPTAATWGLMVAAVLTVPLGAIDAGARLVDPAILPFGVAVAIFSRRCPTLEMMRCGGFAADLRHAYGFEPAIAAVAGAVLLHEPERHAWSASPRLSWSIGAVKGERPELLTERGLRAVQALGLPGRRTTRPRPRWRLRNGADVLLLSLAPVGAGAACLCRVPDSHVRFVCC